MKRQPLTIPDLSADPTLAAALDDATRRYFFGETPIGEQVAPEPWFRIGDPETVLLDDDEEEDESWGEPTTSEDDEGDKPKPRSKKRQITNTNVYLYGVIGGWFGITAESFNRVVRQIQTDRITLHIHSPGGSVNDGFAIYNTLADHPSEIHAIVDGYAASMASLILMVAEDITVSTGGMVMIHDPVLGIYGNADDLSRAAKILDKIGNMGARVYAARAGGTAADWRARMKEENWYDGPEAVSLGLADRCEDVVGESNDALYDWRSFLATREPVDIIMEDAGSAASPPPDTSPLLPAVTLADLPDDVNVFAESHLSIIGEADSTPNSDRTKFRMLVLVPGMSGQQINYPIEKVRAAAHKLEGRPIFVDHDFDSIYAGRARSLTAKAGYWTDVRMETVDVKGVQRECLVATANLVKSGPASWVRDLVIETLDSGHPEFVGISILAAMRTHVETQNGKTWREVDEIVAFLSADAVSEPGAGGRPLNVVAASAGKDMDVDVLEKANSLAEIFAKAPHLSLAEIRQARPEFFNEDGTPKLAAEASPSATTDPAPASVSQPTVTQPTVVTDPALAARLEAMERAETQRKLTTILAASGLPERFQQRIRTEIGEAIVGESEINEKVEEYRELANAAMQASPAAQLAAGPQDSVIRMPYGMVQTGLSPIDQIQLSLDHWFDPRLVKDEDKGKFPRIRSFRETYVMITGDRYIDGQYHPEYSIIGEALPTATKIVGGGTVTMSNLVGTSMNRALVNQYRTQPKWWSPIVSRVELNDLKQQDRIRLHDFGSLTNRTTAGSEYTELTWGETAEAYSPTQYGNLVTVAREHIINDDMEGFRRLPTLLGNAAVVTLNEYMSAKFTANSGTGSALADTYNVFDASNHQSNLGSSALSRAALIAAQKVLLKMTNDASKRIGFPGRYLLVPVDLFDVGYELLTAERVPDSANNARNVIADDTFGIPQMIVVPNWTDANNWYLMADPSTIACLELGFLFGKEEPDLLSQQDPTSGLVWTHDALSWKVRHEYGADWIDYRGAFGAVVS